MITLVNNFITHEQAGKILSSLQLSELNKNNSEHPNELGDFHISSGIPELYEPILDKLVEQGHFTERPDAITINEYLPDQSIEPHVDDVTYGEKVAVITLLGESHIVFTNPIKRETNAPYLHPLSLIYWTGEDRWESTHTIPPVKERRISIVIRKQSC